MMEAQLSKPQEDTSKPKRPKVIELPPRPIKRKAPGGGDTRKK
jgi:hypothetical protein